MLYLCYSTKNLELLSNYNEYNVIVMFNWISSEANSLDKFVECFMIIFNYSFLFMSEKWMSEWWIYTKLRSLHFKKCCLVYIQCFHNVACLKKRNVMMYFKYICINTSQDCTVNPRFVGNTSTEHNFQELRNNSLCLLCLC